jgi:hypothetical protein
MKPFLEKRLVKKFPNLFSDYAKDMKLTAMCWGCECGDGWYKILYQVCQKLEPLVVKWMKEHPKELEFKPRFSQVKEKFGTLRIYLTSGTDEMYKITDKAEKKSEKVCETCGRPGKLRGMFWLYTACFKHAKPEDKEIQIVDNNKVRIK